MSSIRLPECRCKYGVEDVVLGHYPAPVHLVQDALHRRARGHQVDGFQQLQHLSGTQNGGAILRYLERVARTNFLENRPLPFGHLAIMTGDVRFELREAPSRLARHERTSKHLVCLGTFVATLGLCSSRNSWHCYRFLLEHSGLQDLWWWLARLAQGRHLH